MFLSMHQDIQKHVRESLEGYNYLRRASYQVSNIYKLSVTVYIFRGKEGKI